MPSSSSYSEAKAFRCKSCLLAWRPVKSMAYGRQTASIVVNLQKFVVTYLNTNKKCKGTTKFRAKKCDILHFYVRKNVIFCIFSHE